MKHGRHDSVREADPEEIARSVRGRVAARLTELRYTPTDPTGFPIRIGKLAAALTLWGTKTNLTARPQDPAETAFHVIDSLMPAVIADGPDPGMLAGAFGPGKRILDLGSGAGFPGLVLAAATQAHFTLVEARRKRTSFLAVVIAEMGLTNALVESAHVDPSHFAAHFDLVTARALGEPASFYPIASAALRQGGVAMLYASPSQRLSLDKARQSGLEAYTRVGYRLERGGTKVDRILALWTRT